MEATYGSGDKVVDVTQRLQVLVRNGTLCVTVTNGLFAIDPAPNVVKTLRFSYEIPGLEQTYQHEAEERSVVLIPSTGSKNVGIFYSNLSVPPKYLERVLRQLEKARGDIDIIACPWHPIPNNPFPELDWPYHVSSHLTITLQILKLLHTAQAIGPYEYVFFLEHDVLYPESYFEFEPFTEDVLSNSNYMGLGEDGFLPDHLPQEPLHQIVMRLPAAIEHFTSILPAALTMGTLIIEPWGRSSKTRQSAEPTVHINHGMHFTTHHRIYAKDAPKPSQPYWGAASTWWD